MKKLIISGLECLVDDKDYDNLKGYKWNVTKIGNGYLYRNITVDGKQTGIFMHREIMGNPKGKLVDHINGNSLDNRRKNLRFATQPENSRNKIVQKNNKCGFKGVYWENSKSRWRAAIQYEGKRFKLGTFGDKFTAARAYNEAAKRLFGQFAKLNTI